MASKVTDRNDNSMQAMELSASFATAITRLKNACQDASLTAQQAVDLTVDPVFRSWLQQLHQVHKQSATEFETLLQSFGEETWASRSLLSRMRRVWMRCSSAISAGSAMVIMSACRREEYRVQTAYELALWFLPVGQARETVEGRFQQFILHRSMIPARRLPRTEQFLQQAERLQEIHTPDSAEVPPMIDLSQPSDQPSPESAVSATHS